MPFHAVLNYDGQLTGQHGIHARFEAYLFERYRDQWAIAPKPIAPIRNPRDYIFDVVLQGTQLVPPILKSDLDAIGGRDEYDDVYYAAFFKVNWPSSNAVSMSRSPRLQRRSPARGKQRGSQPCRLMRGRRRSGGAMTAAPVSGGVSSTSALTNSPIP